MLLEDKQQTKV